MTHDELEELEYYFNEQRDFHFSPRGGGNPDHWCVVMTIRGGGCFTSYDLDVDSEEKVIEFLKEAAKIDGQENLMAMYWAPGSSDARVWPVH